MSEPVIAGADLDAEIAERVMGWTSVCGNFPELTGRRGRVYVDMTRTEWSGVRPEGDSSEPIPPYSTDISAAWEVIRHIAQDERVPVERRNLQLVAYCYNRTYAVFGVRVEDEDEWSEGNGEHSTPLAICLAALKAVEQGELDAKTLSPKTSISDTPDK